MVECNCWEISIWSIPVFKSIPTIPVFISVQIISDCGSVPCIVFIDHQHKHGLSGQLHFSKESSAKTRATQLEYLPRPVGLEPQDQYFQAF